MSQNPYVIDVNETNFEAQVLQASLQTPIVLDFWAEWCGPCKTLGPILEQLAAEYNGAFVLAKVDVDKAQQLAGMFGIQSIPTVVLFNQGQPADGFQGALPAGQIRELLAKHGIQPAVGDEPDAEPELTPSLSPADLVAKLRQEIAADATNDELKLDLAVALLATGESSEASDLLAHLPANLSTDARAQRAQSHLDLLQRLPAGWNLTDLRAAVAGGDAAARYNGAVAEILTGDPAVGLESLIGLMRDDRQFGDDLARKTLIDAFRILPDAALVAQYRRKLSSLVF